jgi:hypothetical protein
MIALLRLQSNAKDQNGKSGVLKILYYWPVGEAVIKGVKGTSGG